MANILAIGNDASLLYTRRLVLEHAGAAVQLASPAEALEWLRSTSFELLVLCQTLRSAEVEILFQVVRSSHPASKVLVLEEPGFSPTDARSEERFDPREGPAALVRRVQSMLAAGHAPRVGLPRQRAAGSVTMMPGGSARLAPRHSGVQPARSDEAEV